MKQIIKTKFEALLAFLTVKNIVKLFVTFLLVKWAIFWGPLGMLLCFPIMWIWGIGQDDNHTQTEA